MTITDGSDGTSTALGSTVPPFNNYERWETWDAIETRRSRANAPDTGIEVREMDVTAFEVASPGRSL